jgi:hypothetical protein
MGCFLSASCDYVKQGRAPTVAASAKKPAPASSTANPGDDDAFPPGPPPPGPPPPDGSTSYAGPPPPGPPPPDGSTLLDGPPPPPNATAQGVFPGDPERKKQNLDPQSARNADLRKELIRELQLTAKQIKILERLEAKNPGDDPHAHQLVMDAFKKRLSAEQLKKFQEMERNAPPPLR